MTWRTLLINDLTTLTQALRERDYAADDMSWPVDSLRLLHDAGCWAHAVPKKFGGAQVTRRHQLETYEAVAAGSLTVALILTQHDAACELLGNCDNDSLAGELLPKLASGEKLATVGISQLTTSRRKGGIAMRAEPAQDGYRISGVMPWVSSAPKADYIVTGAVLPDGQQILGCVATDSKGLTTGKPMPLMGLNGSLTAEVRCDDVEVNRTALMRGPVERVLKIRAPVKHLSVSATGLGMAGRLLDEIQQRAASLPDAIDLTGTAIVQRHAEVRRMLYGAADTLGDPSAELPAMDIRVAVNDLITRLAATLLTLAKGSGYLASHPAQRLLREAMFFLVWSAPSHVQVGTLQRLWK